MPRPIWDVLETFLERILGGFLAILCIASVIRGVLVLLQLRPKFAPNFKSVVVLPSVPRRALPAFGCRCNGRAERAK